MTPLQSILAAFRASAQTEREKGTLFEELIRTCRVTKMRFARTMDPATGKSAVPCNAVITMPAHLLDYAVALTCDQPKHGLVRGDVGTGDL